MTFWQRADTLSHALGETSLHSQFYGCIASETARAGRDESGRAAAQPISMSLLLRVCFVTVFLLAAACGACAQTGAASVTLTGQVSAALSVSAPEARALSEGTLVSTANVDANTVAVSISGSGNEAARVRLPVRLRSNVGYSLRASFLAPNELTVRLSLADVRATGRLVHADALAGVRPDGALADARSERTAFLSIKTSSPPFALLTGPPVSKGGTLNSPDNAVEIVLSIELRPRNPNAAWSTRLTISAAPHSPAGH